MAGLDGYVRAMVEERRHRPADDLLSHMIAVEEEGDRLSTDELVMMTEAVLMAGTDTTRNQLACSIALFAEHPDQWARLVAEPELAPRAVEETMRLLGTARGTARVASEDIDRSEEHTSELQSLMRTSYAVFRLKKTKHKHK